jgi:hypothetical protein
VEGERGGCHFVDIFAVSLWFGRGDWLGGEGGTWWLG